MLTKVFPRKGGLFSGRLARERPEGTGFQETGPYKTVISLKKKKEEKTGWIFQEDVGKYRNDQVRYQRQ